MPQSDPGLKGRHKQGRRYHFDASGLRTHDWRVHLVWLAATPLALGVGRALLGLRPLSMVLYALLFALVLIACRLLHDGHLAAMHYARRHISAPPAVPRKLLGALVLALALFLSSWQGWGQSAWLSLSWALIGLGSTLAAFGIDPLRAKGLNSHPDAARTLRAVHKAERSVKRIRKAADKLEKNTLRTRLLGICDDTDKVLRELERQPGALDRTRKFLTVYIGGLETILQRAEQLPSDEHPTPELLTLFNDLHQMAQRQRQLLREHERSVLDVEIEVMQERLRRES